MITRRARLVVLGPRGVTASLNELVEDRPEELMNFYALVRKWLNK